MPIAAAAVLAGLMLTSCDSAEPAQSSPTPAPTSFAVTGCPIEDAAFCQRAATAATALASRDAAGLMALASLERFNCDEVPAEMVSNCKPGETLRGMGTYAVATKISVAEPEEYRRQFESMFERVEGDVAVRGVGTCGPADPDRRSYHLQFTLTLRGANGGPAQEWLGSLEFVHRDNSWTFPLMYLDSMTAWKTEHADPLRSTACGNVRPWRV